MQPAGSHINFSAYPLNLFIVSGKAGFRSYRFSFNGKEKDDEIYGVTGSMYNYGFRLYDSRIGRFLSPDPLIVKEQKYPELSPYQYASNTPIQAVDLDGKEAIYNYYVWNKQSENWKPVLTTTDYSNVENKIVINTFYNPNGTVFYRAVESASSNSSLYQEYLKLKTASGGYNFTWSFGQGEETREGSGDVTSVSIDYIMAATGGVAAGSKTFGARFKDIIKGTKAVTDVINEIVSPKTTVATNNNKTTRKDVKTQNGDTVRTPQGLGIYKQGVELDTAITISDNGKEYPEIDIPYFSKPR